MSILRKLRALFWKKQLDADMAEEMRAHLEIVAERNRAAGMNAEEANCAAQRQFGNMASIQEQAREGRGWVWLELTVKELGFAGRSLWRARGFSVSVLATLALCLGPNTAILSVLYALVLKPLPFSQPEQLVTIANVASTGEGRRQGSVAQYLDFKTQADQFVGFAYFAATQANVAVADLPVRATGFEVCADFLSILGLRPSVGRDFRPEEQQPGADRVVWIRHETWVQRYAADPGVVGRVLHLDGVPHTIVGVAPAQFGEIFTDAEFFRPKVVRPEETQPNARYAGNVRLIGRLKPGVDPAAGRAQLQALEDRYLGQNGGTPEGAFWDPADRGGYRLMVNDARAELAAPVRSPLLLLQGGAALVLLIGGVNVASLFLARASARRPELAIRQALGAGGGALLRHLLAESALLVGAAGIAGIATGYGLLRVVNHFLPTVVRHTPPVSLDAQVLVIVAAFVVGLVIVMGLIPFVQVSRSGLRHGDTPAASLGLPRRRLLSGLVVGQLALALVLLVGAGLLIQSFARVMAVRPGFDAEQVVQGRVSLPPARYPDGPSRISMQQRMLAALQEMPGVESVSLCLDVSVKESFHSMPVRFHGTPAIPAPGGPDMVHLNVVSPGYFGTMGIRLMAGREFREDDNLQRNPVSIVDQAFAERHFPGQEALGREFTFGTGVPPPGRPWVKIIGVVERANLAGLEARDGRPFVYMPSNQQPSPSFSVLVRSARLESDVVSEMRARVHALDPGLPVYETGALARGLDAMLGSRRVIMVLLGLFALMALVLAAIGLGGVLSYEVTQRTREIGIRGAVGATPRQIVAMILREGLGKVGWGFGFGLLVAVGFSRLLRGMLFDVGPLDPVAYGSVSALLLLVAMIASVLPACRAARVDPVVALRAE